MTSSYDPTRPTVGKIYRDLQIASDGTHVVVGDMTNELMRGLVDDINDALVTDPFDNSPFYLMVHEKKDLQMKSALLRRLLFFPYRPWPEDDTTVFYKDPKAQLLRFCWCLPHHTEMDNILNNSEFYDQEFIEHIVAWKAFDMVKFGFMKDKELKWIPNPRYRDRILS